MKWSEIEASPVWASMPPEQKLVARERYFDEFVAPQAPPEFDQADLRTRWMSSYQPAPEPVEEPGFMDRMSNDIDAAGTMARDAFKRFQGSELVGVAGVTEGVERTGHMFGEAAGEALSGDAGVAAQIDAQLDEELPPTGGFFSSGNNKQRAERRRELVEQYRVGVPFEASQLTQDLRGAGEMAQADISPEGRRAMYNSTLDGSLADPTNIKWRGTPSMYGVGLQAMDVFGQIAPTAAGALATRGLSTRAQLATGAGVSAAQTGGAAGHDEQERVLAMKPQELMQLPLYGELVDSGIDPERARLMTADAAGRGAFSVAAPVGAISGVLTAGVMSRPGQTVLGEAFGGASRLARVLKGGAADAVGEGVTEVMEGTAQRYGAANATGEDRDIMEGTASEALMGAIAGGGMGAASGLGPLEAPPAPPPGGRGPPITPEDVDPAAARRPRRGAVILDEFGNEVPDMAPEPTDPDQLRLNMEPPPTEPDQSEPDQLRLNPPPPFPVPAGPVDGPGPQPDFMVDEEGNATRREDAFARVRPSEPPGPETMAPEDMAQAAFDSTLEVIRQESGKDVPAKVRKAVAERLAGQFGGDPAAMLARNLNPQRVLRPERPAVQSSTPIVPQDVPTISDEQLSIDPAEAPESFGLPKVMLPRTKKRLPKDFDEHHDDLLDFITLHGGLDRDAWQSEGVDPAVWNTRRAQRRNRPFGPFGPVLLRKGKGMTPGQLREKLEQNGFMQQDTEDGQAQNYDDDAVQMVMSALNQGEKFYTDRGRETQSAIAAIRGEQARLNEEMSVASDLRTNVEALYDEASRVEARDELRAARVVPMQHEREALALAELYQAIRDAGGTEKDLLSIELDHTTNERAKPLWALLKELRNGTDRQTATGDSGSGVQAASRQTAAAPESAGGARGTAAPATAQPAAEVDPRDARIAELERALYTDDLTSTRSIKAYNRDEPKAKGVAFIDLIAFKAYNTHFGETGGDVILKHFGEKMVEIAGDSAYRRGGDEFAILSDVSPEHAAELARKLHAALQSSVIELSKDGEPYDINSIPFRFGIGKSDKEAVADNTRRKVAGDRESNPAIQKRKSADAGSGSSAPAGDVPGDGRAVRELTGADADAEGRIGSPVRNAGSDAGGNDGDTSVSAARSATSSEDTVRSGDAVRSSLPRDRAAVTSDVAPAPAVADSGSERRGVAATGKSGLQVPVIKDPLITANGVSTEQSSVDQPKATGNRIVSDEAAEAARAKLRELLGRRSSGLDPEMLQAGVTLAVWHLENGARKFGDFARAMLTDMGAAVRPYLKSWYLAAKFDPRSAAMAADLSAASDVESIDVDGIQLEDGNGQRSVQGSLESGESEAAPAAETVRPARADRVGGRKPRAGRDDAGDGLFSAQQRLPDDGAGANAGRDNALSKRTGSGNSATGGGSARPVVANSRDYVITDADALGVGGAVTKARANIEAIRIAKALTQENRPATPAEQQKLVKYVGWGAGELAQNVFPPPGKVVDGTWATLGAELRELLTKKEHELAGGSTLNAHYTSPAVIRSMYAALSRFGFEGGAVIEPGMGIGHFRGLMPPSMRGTSTYRGIELDPITALIASHLYPDSSIQRADFTKAPLPENFFDLAIGNPPFASFEVKADKKYAAMSLSLHDYFFVKSMDSVRPGGLLMFVTSRYTMDKLDDKARAYLAERANLLGAVRLPQTAFKENAGTEVVTDVIFLRKRLDGEAPSGASWSDVVPMKIDGEEINVNRYFHDHPEMVIGTHSMTGKMRYRNEYTVLPPEGSIEDAFAALVDKLPERVYFGRGNTEHLLPGAIDFAPKTSKDGGFYLHSSGGLMRNVGGLGQPVRVVATVAEADKLGSAAMTERNAKIMRSWLPIKDARAKVLAVQLAAGTDAELSSAQQAMGAAYDAFVKQHGALNQHRTLERTNAATGKKSVTFVYTNLNAVAGDPDAYAVAAIESYNQETGKGARGPMFSKRMLGGTVAFSIDSPDRALAKVLNDTGKADMRLVADLLGMPTEEAAAASLGDLIFQEPGTGRFVTADEYLSGPVKRKLAIAKASGAPQRNIDALTRVVPKDLAPSEIEVALGVGWVPADVVNEFARDVIGVRTALAKYSTGARQWVMEPVQAGGADSQAFSTKVMTAGNLFGHVLKFKAAKVTRWEGVGKDAREVTDAVETEAANLKIGEMRQAWADWVWANPARASTLSAIYNERYNDNVPRAYDGSHMVFPGQNPVYKLHQHQKRVVWRTVQSGNTYLAHSVGAGKTIAMITSGMEQKRLGLIRKPSYVVPNHMLRQFSREFLDLYPGARLLVADEEQFQGRRRKEFVGRAASDDWDGIIITHSAFGKIPVSATFSEQFIGEMLDDLRQALDLVDKGDRTTRKTIERQVKSLEQRLEKSVNQATKDQGVTFEETGIDFLFVDEAHNFRKLDFSTEMSNLKGVDPTGSLRALDLFTKMRYLEGLRPGRSAVLASGTPVTNTMGEMYNLLRYMAPRALRDAGLDSFDGWAAMFGTTRTQIEQTPSGGYAQVTRFNRFVNLGELIAMFRGISDVIRPPDLVGKIKVPTVRTGGREIVASDKSEALASFQRGLQQRIEAIKNRKGPPKKGDDILLKIITDGRFAALDDRFFDFFSRGAADSKLNTAIRNVFDTWKATKDATFTDEHGFPSLIRGATQMIFLDLRKRGGGVFDAYDWIRDELVRMGVPADQIAFMQDYKKAAEKKRLFDDMNSGRKRVLLGSTQAMGEGVNAQRRLVALHHLDAPWFPAAVEQREGRIVRQGNQNEEVQVLAYVTRGTYDATMWQMLENKQRFIDQAMSGDTSLRSMEDLDGSADQFAAAKAIASGDERVVRRAGLEADVLRLGRQRTAHESKQLQLHRDERARVAMEKQRQEKIDKSRKALSKVVSTAGDAFVMAIGAKKFAKRVDAAGALLAAAEKLDRDPDEGVVSYKVGELGGLDVVGYVGSRSGPGGPRRDAPSFWLRVAGGHSGPPYVVVDATGAAGAITSMEYFARSGLQRQIEQDEEAITQAQAELKQIRAELGAPFRYAQDLTDKKAELQALERELTSEADKESAELASAASGVDSEAEDAGPVDDLDEGEGEDSADAGMFSQPMTVGSMPLSDLQKLASAVDAPGVRITVVAGPEGLPAAARAGNGWKTAEAWTDGSGEVFLVAANLSSIDRARAVIAHEVAGHIGVERVIGDDWPAVQAAIEAIREGRGLHAKALGDAVASAARRYPDVDAATFAKEAIAVMAERGITGALWDRIVTAVRKWLRKTFKRLQWSDSEIRDLLRRGAEAVRTRADSSAATAGAYSNKASPFYSALVEAVATGKGAPKRGTAQQWREWLDGSQRRGELKQAERDWMGVDAWLDGQADVTRQQLIDFVKANQVQVQEVVLSEPADVKHSDWQLPGGSNYRELLITMPQRESVPESLPVVQGPDSRFRVRTPTSSGRSTLDYPMAGYETRAEADEHAARSGKKRGVATVNYKSSHFDQLNILAHVRFNERTDTDGTRVLFVEEVQSDWHQAGRKRGYVVKPSGKPWSLFDENTGEAIAGFDTQTAAEAEALRRGGRDEGFFAAETDTYRDAGITGDIGVPDAPLKKEWPLTAMKRVIRYAAENGFDKVAWTTGAQQAERYDLSKQISRVEFDDNNSGGISRPVMDGEPVRGMLRAYDLDGKKVINMHMRPDEVEDHIGKEIAQRLFEVEPKEAREAGLGVRRRALSGLDLKVGGSGMKAFYDKMLPNEVGKYVKKWGGKLGATDLNLTAMPWSEYEAYAVDHPYRVKNAPRVHSIDITPAMRDAALEGQPLFSQPPVNPHTWDAPTKSKLDTVLYELQNRHVDTQRAIEAIEKFTNTPIAPAHDVIAQETVYHGRAAKRTQDFLYRELNPLLKKMASLKIPLESFEHYLWARHASERNDLMAERNPSQVMIDQRLAAAEAAIKAAPADAPNLDELVAERRRWRNAKPYPGTEADRTSLSGMSTADARAYLSALPPADAQKMDTLAAMYDSIIDGTRKLMVSYGLDSKDTVAAMEQAYAFYAPLMRADMDHGHSSIGGQASGFSVKGGSTRAATGSTRAVVDILANVAMQRERVIDRGERNRVAVAVYGLAKTNPNPDFWTVDTPPMRKRLDESTGFVVMEIDPAYKLAPNVLTARIPDPKTGEVKEVAVRFNDRTERAMRAAAALKNLDGQELGWLLSNVAPVTRTMAALSTQYNVIFGLKNFERDLQSALINLTSTELASADSAKKIARNVFPALLGVWAYTRARREGSVPAGVWSQAYERMLNSGGQTGYRDLWLTSEDRGKDLLKAIEHAEQGKVMRSGRALADWLSDYNESIENAIRLAVYEQAIKSGMLPLKAAELAKNSTTNFNRKGASANQIGAMFAFFNASVQGNARVVETLRGGTARQRAAAAGKIASKVGKRIVAGGVLLGVLQALMMAAAGFDEEDPPKFVRERNWIVPIGGGRYMMRPMPLGWNILPNIGRSVTEWALSGGKDSRKRATDFIAMALESFNPLGSTGWSIQMVLPTPLDPFGALAENADFTGREIYRESRNPLDPETGNDRAKPGATEASKLISSALNRVSGGTEYVPGDWSPSPDGIDYLVGQATGGTGRELQKLAATAESLMRGDFDEMPWHKVVLVGNYYGDTGSSASEASKFYINVKMLNRLAREMRGRGENGEGATLAEFRRENPAASFAGLGADAAADIAELKGQRRALEASGASREQLKVIDQQIEDRMRAVNARVEAVTKGVQ